ncbi:MAG: nicotinate-nucleotide adenylyltransferase [Stenotrophomonas sp.]
MPLQLYYGGTFDPFHLGHLAIARGARDELQVPVRLMPAADPPHRAPPGADAAQRARMLELAIAGEPGLQLDLRELRRARRDPGVPSWTVDTLRELRAETSPAQPLALLVGADSLIGLPGWHEWEALLELAHFVVADRPGSALDGPLPPALATYLHGAWAQTREELLRQPCGRVWRLRQPLRGESATQVRRAIENGDAWRPLVPAAVADYIAGHGLYGCRDHA